MKFLNVFMAFILVSFLLTSCSSDYNCTDGQGSVATKVLSVPSFNGIDFQIAGDVVITQGSKQEVSVTGNANVIRNIKTRVSDGVWDINFGKKCFDHYELIVNITTPDIEKVFLSGTGVITINNFSDQSDLNLIVSGSGRINIGAFSGCENLSINISGHGDILADSEFTSLKNLDIVISGSGDYKGFPISTDECDINLSGSGNCEVFVREKLDVKISGSGNVYYEGNPSLTMNISGAGNVVNAN